jgi:hypothetical protein
MFARVPSIDAGTAVARALQKSSLCCRRALALLGLSPLLLIQVSCDAGPFTGSGADPHATPRVHRGTVHYDFVGEDGLLAGGKVSIDLARSLGRLGGHATKTYPYEAVREHGPVDNRIDLVLVGDGYTSAELPLYRESAERVVAAFFGSEALANYAQFFNVYRVDVVSNDSGVDHDLTVGELKDTALDAGYNCQGIERLLCVNVEKALAAAHSAPDVDQVLVIANSYAYGGAGYPDERLGTVAGQNEGAIEIALHEFGHSFAGLADEYGGPERCDEEPLAPNVSTYSAHELSAREHKWYRWLDGHGSVGAFAGAQFCNSGMHRPTENSKMRTLGQPFEAINNEQFVLHFYRVVRPIDDATPDGVYTRDTQFFVAPAPSTTTLVQWFIDDEPITGANAFTFDATTLAARVNPRLLSVRVSDFTPYVRDNSARDRWMTEEREWLIVSDRSGL